MSGAMSQVWGMINGLQIIVNFPLFRATFPDLSGMMVESLITIATFDVLPSGDVIDETLLPPADDEQDMEKFNDIGFESNYMIINLGTMFLMFVIMLTLPACLICTGPCR